MSYISRYKSSSILLGIKLCMCVKLYCIADILSTDDRRRKEPGPKHPWY